MSSAATIHDGLGSLVHLFLMCIVLIVYMCISHIASTHVALFYIICTFFLEESNLVANVRKLVGLRVKFYHFLYSFPKI